MSQRVHASRRGSGSSAPSDADLLRFMQSIPSGLDTTKWIASFKLALARLIPDVDRITINVNLTCRLRRPGAAPPQRRSGSTNAESSVYRETPGEILYRNLTGTEPRDCGVSNVTILDYSSDGEYLGTIILWTDPWHPAISARSLSLIESLRSFVVFCLTDLIVRFGYVRPYATSFAAAIEAMAEKCHLTPAETAAIVLRLRGYDYRTVARHLNVSLDAARKRLQSAYRKTDVRSTEELWAKYLGEPFA